MAKAVFNVLGMALALSIGVMLVSADSASSVLGATGNSSMKSGNMTKASEATSKAGSATAGNVSKAGNATAGNMSKAAGNITKTASNVASKVGGGLKGLGNLISGGKK